MIKNIIARRLTAALRNASWHLECWAKRIDPEPFGQVDYTSHPIGLALMQGAIRQMPSDAPTWPNGPWSSDDRAV